MDYSQQVNEAHRALGRYVYEFSRLVFTMRTAIARALDTTGKSYHLTELLLGEATAQPIANSLFGVIRAATELTAAEEAVLKVLRKQVNDTITMRNAIAHGDWWIGWGSPGAEQMDPPALVRTRPMRAEGAIEHQSLGPADLDKLSEAIVTLRNRVGEAADLAIGTLHLLKGTRIGDYLVVKHEQVVREGPKVGDSTVSYL